MGAQQLPSVGLLLAIDAEYRKKAAADQLKKITPKRFNPEGKAWLPIMNTEREGWKFAVLFSNTQRAHELGKTNDWVVLYYDDGRGERKCTVVTEFKGSLSGKRVIRGREKECAEYFNA
jgi:DNA polymerase (family 10)